MRVRILALSAVALLAACEAEVGEPFESRVALLVDSDNDPLAEATSIRLTLHLADGTVVEDSRSLEGGELRLEGLDEAEVLSLDVELRDADNAVVGLGRSQGFSLGPDGLQASVFVGRTDTISRVPDSLTRARTFARGAYLPDGRIVVVGGGDNEDETIAPIDWIGWFPNDPVTALAGAELPRIGHEVVFIPEGTGDWGGKVAVLGGTFGAGDDTLSGGWENAPTAVALIDVESGGVDPDGGELSSGYMDARAVQTPEGLIALVGGFNRTSDGDLPYTNSIVLVDPASGEQVTGPELPSGTTREQHAAVAFEAQGNDFVLITGGYLDQNGHVERDLLWSGQQSDAPLALTRDDPTGRARHQATDLGTGQVLISGGATGMSSVGDAGDPLDTAEIFDPALDGGTFEPIAALMDEARQRHVAARIPGGRVLVCAGEGVDGRALTTCEVFTMDTRRFDPFPASVNPGGPGMTAIPAPDGRVFLVGGATGLGPTRALHIYTPPRWQDGS